MLDDEGVILLMFANKNMVVGAVDYSRELAPWAGKCYLRADAVFKIAGLEAGRIL